MPFLAVGLVLLLENKKLQRYVGFLFMLSFIIAGASAIALHFQPPSQGQLNAIDYAMFATKPDYEMQNDWGLGYWIRWKGGYTQNAAGGPHTGPPG